MIRIVAGRFPDRRDRPAAVHQVTASALVQGMAHALTFTIWSPTDVLL